MRFALLTRSRPAWRVQRQRTRPKPVQSSVPLPLAPLPALTPVACEPRRHAPAARMAVPLTLAARCAAPAAVRLQRSAASLAPRVAAAARDVAGTPLRLAARPRRAGARGLASVGGSRLLVTAASSDAPPSAESLNAAHGIPGSVAFAVHPGGGLKAVLTHANGSSAEVHLQGATVTSYCQPSGDEVLYLRPDAVFDGSKPIAGGVPICFPIFGPGAMQQHGFARNSLWAVHRSCADVNPDYPEPCVTLRLADSAATRSMWAHSFEALLEVTLKRDSLLLAFRVRNANAGGESFDFTAALHSYFEVVDAALPAVRVTGLKGKAYLDKVPDPKAPARRTEDADAVCARWGRRCSADAPCADLLLPVLSTNR